MKNQNIDDKTFEAPVERALNAPPLPSREGAWICVTCGEEAVVKDRDKFYCSKHYVPRY